MVRALTFLILKNTYTLASGNSVKVIYNVENVYGFLICFQTDINGSKGPNIQGRDLFELFVYYTKNGIIIDDLQLTGSVLGPLAIGKGLIKKEFITLF